MNEMYIELDKKDIKRRFDEYNKLYFGGKLGKCKFFYLFQNSQYGKYLSYYDNNGNLISKIGIGRCTRWTDGNLRELLVHEMIHMYVRTIEGKRHDGVLGHGRRFRRHCRRIKRDYGLTISIHGEGYGYIKKEYYPKRWEKVLLWIIDR